MEIVDEIYRILVRCPDPFREKAFGKKLMEIVVKSVPPLFLNCRMTIVRVLQRMLIFYGMESSYIKEFEKGDVDESYMIRFDPNNTEYAVLNVFVILHSAESWKWEDPIGFLDLLYYYCKGDVEIALHLFRPLVLVVTRTLSLLIKENNEAMINRLLGRYWDHIIISTAFYSLDPSEMEKLATYTSPKVALASRTRFTSINFLPVFQKSKKARVLELFDDKESESNDREDDDDELYTQLSAFFYGFLTNLPDIVGSYHTFKGETNPIRSKLSAFFNLRIGGPARSSLLPPITTQLQQLKDNYFKKMDARSEYLLAVCMEIFILQLKGEKSNGPYELSSIRRIDDDTIEFISPKSTKPPNKLNTESDDVKPPELSIDDILKNIGLSNENKPSKQQRGKKGTAVQATKPQGKEKSINSPISKDKSRGDKKPFNNSQNVATSSVQKITLNNIKANNTSIRTPEAKRAADGKNENARVKGRDPDEEDEELQDQNPPKKMKQSSEIKPEKQQDSIVNCFIFLADGTAEPKFDRDGSIRQIILQRINNGKNFPFLLSESFYTGLTSKDHNVLRNSKFKSWNNPKLTKSRLELWEPEQFIFKMDEFYTHKNSKKHQDIIDILKSIHKNEPEITARLWSLCKYGSKHPFSFQELQIDISQCHKPVSISHGWLVVDPEVKAEEVKQYLMEYLTLLEMKKQPIKDENSVVVSKVKKTPFTDKKSINETQKAQSVVPKNLIKEPIKEVVVNNQVSSVKSKDESGKKGVWGKGEAASKKVVANEEFPPLPTTTTATAAITPTSTTTTTVTASTTTSTVENPDRGNDSSQKDASSSGSISTHSSNSSQPNSPMPSTSILFDYNVIDIGVEQSIQEQRKNGIYPESASQIDLRIDAEFLAFDFELTGLSDGTDLSYLTLEDKIKGIRVNSIVQVGLMPMRVVAEDRGNLKVEQAGPLYRIPVTAHADPRKVMWQEKSKQFLIDNNFSIEEWQLKAVPIGALDKVWNLMKTKKLIVHNGLTDLLHLLKALNITISTSCKTLPDLIDIFTRNKIQFYDSRVLMLRMFPYRPEGLDVVAKEFLKIASTEAKFHDSAFDAFCTGRLVQKFGPLYSSELNFFNEMRDKEEPASTQALPTSNPDSSSSHILPNTSSDFGGRAQSVLSPDTNEVSKGKSKPGTSSSPEPKMNAFSPSFSISTSTTSFNSPTNQSTNSNSSSPPQPTRYNFNGQLQVKS